MQKFVAIFYLLNEMYVLEELFLFPNCQPGVVANKNMSATDVVNVKLDICRRIQKGVLLKPNQKLVDIIRENNQTSVGLFWYGVLQPYDVFWIEKGNRAIFYMAATGMYGNQEAPKGWKKKDMMLWII